MAAPKASSISVNLSWKDFASNYYIYNWKPERNAFVYAGENGVHDYKTLIDFGDTSDPKMHDVLIVFGPEITKEKWNNKTEVHIKFRAGKDVDTEIIVDDFEFVYYGGTCGGEEHSYSVSWASIEWPKELTSEEAKIGLPKTFYGRVNIPGLTNATVNKSEFLMGVRAQFGVMKVGVDPDYTWYEAEVNEAFNDGSGIGNAFGDNDEYKYTYSFESAGQYKYEFRFSADNGKTWTQTSAFQDIGDHTGTGTANVSELSDKDIIWNGDFSIWSDTDPAVPWLWTSDEGTIEKATFNSNPALKVSVTKGSKAKSALRSHTFEISDSAKLPQKIAFKLATDQTVTMSILLKCGSQSYYYKWNKTDHFVTNKSWQYQDNNVPLTIDFGNNDLNETWIDTSNVTAANWNGKTCSLEFKFGSDSSNDRWAIFDDIVIVPAE